MGIKNKGGLLPAAVVEWVKGERPSEPFDVAALGSNPSKKVCVLAYAPNEF